MASPEDTSGPKEAPEEPWKPPQRPQKQGIAYDDLGMEMAPNARVWRRYVEETDKMDKELVEGWNNSLDIILIFAALFSAISTAFVIESSKDLKPDYSQTSAQTLQLMSQTLSAIARGSPLNESDAPASETTDFLPSSSAVAVNALWFLSLGLSVAVSLIAILGKEWCHSFMAGRVGSMLRQSRLRQERWNGIERWKMKEILYVLPLLMHTALLLFAVGLSLYLWDINVGVALPVVITTSLAALFYVVTVSLPLFFRFCPYTTALARFLYPYWLAILGNPHTMDTIGALTASLAWISYNWMRLKQSILVRCLKSRFANSNPIPGNDLEATRVPRPNITPVPFRQVIQETHDSITKWIESMRAMFLTDRSRLAEEVTPMDDVTSSMIAWMIANCEDSRSVDIALQALAGAEQPLPRLPLWECGAIQLLCGRIDTSLDALRSRPSQGTQLVNDTFLDDASLYSRSFCFLTAFIAGEGLDMQDHKLPRFVVNRGHGLPDRFNNMAKDAAHRVCYRLDEILNCAWDLSPPRYDLVAYEFNSVPIKACNEVWTTMELYRKQCQKQQEIVQRIASGKISSLSPKVVVSLVTGIAKTYIHNTSQSPKLMVDLLHLLKSQENRSSECRRSFGVGLVIAVIAAGSYPTRENMVDTEASDTNSKRLSESYARLVEFREGTIEDSADTLLCFGLLCLLTHKCGDEWSFDAAQVELIREELSDCYTSHSYHEVLPEIPASLDRHQHLIQVILGLLSAIPPDEGIEHTPGFTLPIILRIETALSYPLHYNCGGQLVPLLIQHFTLSQSVEAKRLCLKGIRRSLGLGLDQTRTVLDTLLETAFLERVLSITNSIHEDLVITLYGMEFLWNAVGVILYNCTNEEWNPEDNRSAARLLVKSLHNLFMITSISAENSCPMNLTEVGFADLWLSKIEASCRCDPRSVLRSNILSVMIDFYESDKYTSAKPRTHELPKPFDNTWTWLKIFQQLEKDCREVVEQQLNCSVPLNEGPQIGSSACGAGEWREEYGLYWDIYDWSI